jgi:S1-C subfamily serine protease
MNVRVQGLPAAELAARSGNAAGGADGAETSSMGKLGVTVAPVTRDDIARFDLTTEQRGLLVTDVRAGGPSWGELVDAGRGGPDIILEVEGKAVKTADDLRRALQSTKSGEIVSVRVYNTQAKNRRIERIRLGE